MASVSDALELRQLLTAVSMTDQEQLLLELVNRARANPQAEANRYGVALNQGLDPGQISTAAKQPLAPHQSLTNAAGLHSQDMINRDFFDHTNPDNLTEVDRGQAAGYPTAAIGENIAWEGTTGVLDNNAAVYLQHEALFLSPGHRANMLHIPYEEIGVGIRYGKFLDAGTNYNAILVTENFGIRSVNPFITGVAYTDTDGDNFYSIGEAIRSGTVTATEATSGLTYTADIGVSGGYGMIVPAGVYSVVINYTANGTQFTGQKAVSVGSNNVKVDFKASETTSAAVTIALGASTISETGSTTLTLTRSGATTSPLLINLSSSDTSDATLPASVTIPAGQAGAQVTVTGVADTSIDGNQTVTISAFPAGLATRTTTLTVTDASVPVIPGGIIDTNSTMPTITWNAMDNATRYAVWANYASGPTNGIINVSNISTNSYTPTTELGIGVYWIWVRGFTSSNAASAWSTPKMMRVKTPPSITGAANRTVTDPDFSVSWEALPGAAYYDVWVDQLSTSTSAYFRNSHVNGTSVDLTGFEPGKYGIWVRGFTARGDVGNWSPRTTITVAPTAQNVNVTAASVTSTPTLNWDAIPGMSTYAVWVNNPQRERLRLSIRRELPQTVSNCLRFPPDRTSHGFRALMLPTINTHGARHIASRSGSQQRY
ncbi:MAG: CAP domain-containing protein [Planctomycetaceae bacterium]